MIDIDDLNIVNYSHPNTTPLQNICRLPEKEAFALAAEMSQANPDTTAFYRMADFANYYPHRMKVDELLYSQFIALGGKPMEKHPLSFVLHGSQYLHDWFSGGHITKIPLREISAEHISFTLGDSMGVYKNEGKFEN